MELMFFIGTVSYAVPKDFLSFIRQILLVAGTESLILGGGWAYLGKMELCFKEKRDG